MTKALFDQDAAKTLRANLIERRDELGGVIQDMQWVMLFKQQEDRERELALIPRRKVPDTEIPNSMPRTTRELLRLGKYIDTRDKADHTVLQNASRDRAQAGVVRLLMKCNNNHAATTKGMGLNAVHLAAVFDHKTALRETKRHLGAEPQFARKVDARDSRSADYQGSIVARRAINYRKWEKLLSTMTRQGKTPLHLAV
ncbi:hypothetical protein B0T14DRAFT_572163 [Immersiella caudata]|uniref:Uncharacterized protein n=1 Tax=Immersiella caudata TaxID=314043 RepID=A0AA39TLH3_9PEZI|nr:hypothetical protein B0T14DRAFT_572163 [Immersiella caudata]